MQRRCILSLSPSMTYFLLLLTRMHCQPPVFSFGMNHDGVVGNKLKVR